MNSRNSVDGIKVYVESRYVIVPGKHPISNKPVDRVVHVLDIKSGNNVLECTSENIEMGEFLHHVGMVYGESISDECRLLLDNNGKMPRSYRILKCRK